MKHKTSTLFVPITLMTWHNMVQIYIKSFKQKLELITGRFFNLLFSLNFLKIFFKYIFRSLKNNFKVFFESYIEY